MTVCVARGGMAHRAPGSTNALRRRVAAKGTLHLVCCVPLPTNPELYVLEFNSRSN